MAATPDSEREPRLLRPNGRRYETAQQAIKEYVVDRRLPPGAALPPEGRLAAELQISRTSIREAVKALESLGILETRPGVGIFVRAFSLDPILDNLAYGLLQDPSTLAELLHIRKHLEASAIEEVAATATPNQLRVLRSAVDRMGELIAASSQTTEFPEEDRFFHRALYAGLQNRLLLKILDVYWEVYLRLRGEVLQVERADPVRTWESHRSIVDALARHDPAAARVAMLDAFRGIEGRIQRAELGRAGRPDERA